jgi:hypothetical protein
MSRKPGWKMPEETKAKLRAARLANNPMKGAHHTHEARAKMRAANNPAWRKGEDAVNWKGGRTLDKKGYVLIYMPEHPNAVGKYVPEHRIVMEKKLGRLLKADEDVHHMNHQKGDNRPENLMLIPHGEHSTMHNIENDHHPDVNGRWHPETFVSKAKKRR